jgi:hypothetical protein
MLLETLLGREDVELWVALVIERSGRDDIETFDEVEELLIAHWHRGALLLQEERKRSDAEGFRRSLGGFMEELVQRATSFRSERSATPGTEPVSPSGPIHPIPLRVGASSDPSQSLSWTFNATGQTPHIGVFGNPGKGKTRLARDLMLQLKKAALPMFIFDPKGDLAGDSEFIAAIGARALSVGRSPIPLHALVIGDLPTNSATRVADDLAEALKRTSPGIGQKQREMARTTAEELLQSRRAVGLSDIYAAVERRYEDEGLKADTLIATLRRFRDYNLFEPREVPAEFFGQTTILSFHEANNEVVRFSMVFVLDALLRWLRALPDEPKAAGVQRFRLVLVIDEAKRIMEAAPKEMMEALILECRSKGLGTLLISQSPDHLDGLSDDLVRSLEVAVCFEADVEARSLQRMFNRAKPETVRQLQKGQCLVRTPNSKTPKVIQAWVPSSE